MENLKLATPDAAFFRLLPKAELHLHLTGAVRAETFVELAQRYGTPLPAFDNPIDIYRFKGLSDFLVTYEAIGRTIRTAADFQRVTYETLADLSGNGVRYVEMFISPEAPMAVGVTYPTMLEGIRAGLRDGEHDFGLIARIIPAHNRELGPERSLEFLDLVLAHRNDDILGIGLDYSEVKSPPALFVELYRRAKKAGLRLTAHAGEEGPGRHVLDSLDLLGCERVDHGYRVVDESEAVRLALKRGTYFTVCPTTMQFVLGESSPSENPIKRMDDLGVSFVIGSDDPTLLHTNLVNEYQILGRQLGFNREKFKQIALNGVRAAWLDESTRVAWLSEWNSQMKNID